MSDLFLGIVSLSLSASWLVAAVMAFRFLLKKAPKAMHVALWGLVALRLILPVSFESALSLVPESISSGAVVEEWVQTPIGSTVIAVKPEGAPLQTDIPVQSPDVPDVPMDMHSATTAVPAPTLEDTLVPLLTSVWILGMGAMAVYALGSYAVLRWQVRTAVRLDGNIYQSEFAPTAFVLGLLRPRIYVPYGMDDGDLVHVVAHERSHIARLDHWWKPLGFLLLTLHWFNPLMWLAYFLLCRDIELACDERVIRSLERNQRADYSQTLLTCSIHEKMIFACPVAFGQAGVKERVRNVLNYRKPGLWITAVTVLAMIVSMVCFYAVPPAQADEPDPTVTPPTSNASVNSGKPNPEQDLLDKLKQEKENLRDQMEQLQSHMFEPNEGSSQRLTTGDGIEYTVSATNVTPVGMRFNVDVDAKCTFLVENYYWIERQTENGWEALPAMLEDPCHMAWRFGASGNPIFPSPTDSRPVDWSGIYGVLEPGTYRLCTVVFEGEDPVRVEFTIGDPGKSAAALALTRYYRALDALLTQESYHVVYTYSDIEDPTVDVDADVYDRNFIDTHEYMRAGDDYLVQDYTYTTGMLNDGFMIRDGIKYRMENEIHGNGTTPAIGWAQQPGVNTDLFTRWVSCWTMSDITSVEMTDNTTVLNLKPSGSLRRNTVTVTYDESGGLKEVVHVEEYSSYNKQKAYTSTYTLTVKDTDAEAITERINLQNVNFLRSFVWMEAVPEDEIPADRVYINADPVAMDTVSDVIEQAKKECTVTYTNIMVSYDAQNLVWKVEFLVGYGLDCTEVVYLNADGTTLAIAGRGPRDN